MITPHEYYTTSLYPLQDGILKIVTHLNTPFYLTGGTALSRCYFHHRYSDDLDFFVNADPGYAGHVKKILRELQQKQAPDTFIFHADSVIVEESYCQFAVSSRPQAQECRLKIELINDVAERLGGVDWVAPFGKVDNVLNILSNKLSAVYRFEPKDIADIWMIAKNTDFQWPEIVQSAKEKELGLDVLKISEIIKSLPPAYIDIIKWAMPIDRDQIKKELSIIADDILWGRENSLNEKPSDIDNAPH